ncbi:gluconate 2-dehydrogenase subunit 3 family protein [Thalassotalea agarivorans]|uniref:Gluconate 2-dehydrogenase subunit 3 n=2 Tax=Thalassotalea agarivorans TaxID=349064 RepID=A0A1I0HPV3_THASX|nr:gluconate 2-dehydrogenase subunit 3 family protein [Thalassotalea agarivorans]SET85294.1 Gluconate 2-dehydrogenase subunit 3 [Thalassotalea agarivorans]
MQGFFDSTYKTPAWYRRKIENKARRKFLKSAMGASALTLMPVPLLAKANQANDQRLATDPWLTLDSTLNHLLPQSEIGPSAKDIQAIQYLFNVIDQQPIDEDEKAFIFKGVGWLNGFCQSKLNKNFVELEQENKEAMLRAISGSTAGRNWINTLINYLFEAMLSPPAYGGNPNGVGWTWLQHQAGFPLPKEGSRYYELPTYQQIKISFQPWRKNALAKTSHPNGKKAV